MNRRDLANALTLIESSKEADRQKAVALLESASIANSNNKKLARRIGITGSPGVGKSTLLEKFGLELIDKGHKVAVLAIDPTSRRTGGSIMGDKVRMPRLSVHENAFIRPSPSGTMLGGTAETTADAIILCEAAGFDAIIVETVGIGQSEIEAANMVDMFLLLVLPSSGDDVQGIKRGVMEVSDGVVITKTDTMPDAAKRSAAAYGSALRLMLPSKQSWQSQVVMVNSIDADGLQPLHTLVEKFFHTSRIANILDVRNVQRRYWFDEIMKRSLSKKLTTHSTVADRLATLRDEIDNSSVPPSVAVERVMNEITISITEKS